MGQPGNWSDRKVAQVRSENARAAWKLMDNAVYFDEGGNLYFSAHTPCADFGARHDLKVGARCYGCRRLWWFGPDEIMHTKFSHRPWLEVVRVLRCTACDHPVDQLTFSDHLNEVLGTMIAKLPPTAAEAAVIPKPKGVPIQAEPLKGKVRYRG